jgi:hypothetical protein
MLVTKVIYFNYIELVLDHAFHPNNRKLGMSYKYNQKEVFTERKKSGSISIIISILQFSTSKSDHLIRSFSETHPIPTN